MRHARRAARYRLLRDPARKPWLRARVQTAAPAHNTQRVVTARACGYGGYTLSADRRMGRPLGGLEAGLATWRAAGESW